MPAIPALAQRLLQVTLLRYIGASVIALAFDMGLFLAFLAAGWVATMASAASYIAGIIVHWLVSSRLVFIGGARTIGAKRIRQKGLFLITALVGLLITVLVVALGSRIGIDAKLSKLAAIAVSFSATYLLRKMFVFAES